MPEKTIDQYEFEDIMYEANADEVNDTYSGRGMYGESCIAASGDDLSLVRIGLEIGMSPDLDDAIKRALVRSARQDSMGRGTVVYFPGWKFTNEDEDDE